MDIVMLFLDVKQNLERVQQATFRLMVVVALMAKLVLVHHLEVSVTSSSMPQRY